MDDGSESAEEDGDPQRLLDRIMRYQGRGGSVAVILMIVGVVGLLLLGGAAVRTLAQPWELDAASPVAQSRGSECGPFAGGRFVIEVGGQRHLCGGSDTKCGDEGPVAVAYDPEDPSRCRVATHVDDLSGYELLLLTLMLGFTAAGAAGAAYSASERLRLADIVDGEANRAVQRARLRRLAGLGLILGVILCNGFGVFFLLTSL